MRSRHLNTKILKNQVTNQRRCVLFLRYQEDRDDRLQEAIQKKNNPSSPFRDILLFTVTSNVITLTLK